MKKLFITGITAAAVFATCTATAFAAPSIIVNSNTLATDQEPVIVDSRTLVPMRAIFEALGCEVKWDADSKTVHAQKDLQYLSLAIGEDTLYTSKDTITLDVPAQIINGRTMVPLRAVSEALQATVSWDAATETVTIQSAILMLQKPTLKIKMAYHWIWLIPSSPLKPMSTKPFFPTSTNSWLLLRTVAQLH